eukprot:6819082-Pyramimonas_sp.AAC.1
MIHGSWKDSQGWRPTNPVASRMEDGYVSHVGKIACGRMATFEDGYFRGWRMATSWMEDGYFRGWTDVVKSPWGRAHSPE